ncbi:MAG: phosphatase PAP2 family protein [Azovibrio sp.]|nr:phosphatase PAP2 family protein [Azovibrio sp.]
MPPLTAPPLTPERRWVVSQALLLLASALLLLLVFEHSSLDLDITRRLYDPTLAQFPWRHHWLFDHVLHHGMKQASYGAVAAALYFCYLGWKGELTWLPRRNALLAALGMLLIPIGTTVLKSITDRHCPWDLLEFGGFAPYLPLLAPHPDGIKAGECFPAGHASAGFLWIVWGMALRPAGRRLARYGLGLGLGLGALMGWARMMQGAHFLSHTLWSLWFAWAVSLALALLTRADLRLGAADALAARADPACPDPATSREGPT